MNDLKDLEKRMRDIEERNKKVEVDKAWELSYFRRFLLTLFTYLSIGFYLQAINIARPWLNAIVPAIAFMLSTLTLPFFKKLWINHKKVNTNLKITIMMIYYLVNGMKLNPFQKFQTH